MAQTSVARSKQVDRSAPPPPLTPKAESRPASQSSSTTAKMKPSYKHVPHSQKPPHLVAKRNARERRRVQAVNQAFYKLRKSVPIENRNKRVSKVKTLQRAIDYIRKLERILAEDEDNQADAPNEDSSLVSSSSGLQPLVSSSSAQAEFSVGLADEQQAAATSRTRERRATNSKTKPEAVTATATTNCDDHQQDSRRQVAAGKPRRGRKAIGAQLQQQQPTTTLQPPPPPQQQHQHQPATHPIYHQHQQPPGHELPGDYYADVRQHATAYQSEHHCASSGYQQPSYYYHHNHQVVATAAYTPHTTSAGYGAVTGPAPSQPPAHFETQDATQLYGGFVGANFYAHSAADGQQPPIGQGQVYAQLQAPEYRATGGQQQHQQPLLASPSVSSPSSCSLASATPANDSTASSASNSSSSSSSSSAFALLQSAAAHSSCGLRPSQNTSLGPPGGQVDGSYLSYAALGGQQQQQSRTQPAAGTRSSHLSLAAKVNGVGAYLSSRQQTSGDSAPTAPLVAATFSTSTSTPTTTSAPMMAKKLAANNMQHQVGGSSQQQQQQHEEQPANGRSANNLHQYHHQQQQQQQPPVGLELHQQQLTSATSNQQQQQQLHSANHLSASIASISLANSAPSLHSTGGITANIALVSGSHQHHEYQQHQHQHQHHSHGNASAARLLQPEYVSH